MCAAGGKAVAVVESTLEGEKLVKAALDTFGSIHSKPPRFSLPGVRSLTLARYARQPSSATPVSSATSLSPP
jgi:hypothetical protein